MAISTIEDNRSAAIIMVRGAKLAPEGADSILTLSMALKAGMTKQALARRSFPISPPSKV